MQFWSNSLEVAGTWPWQLILLAVVGFVVSFALSLGPIPWQIACLGQLL